MPCCGFSRLGILLLFPFAACSPPGDDGGSGGGDTVTAATLGVQSVRTTAEYLAEERFANANTALGERLVSQCRACHTLEPGGAPMLGPNLSGMFGRPAGGAEGFDYSDALADADFTWTPRALDAWLAQPGRFLPGNRMVFAGVPHAADREALIAVLLRRTATAH